MPIGAPKHPAADSSHTKIEVLDLRHGLRVKCGRYKKGGGEWKIDLIRRGRIKITYECSVSDFVYSGVCRTLSGERDSVRGNFVRTESGRGEGE